jgi:hypothetical protein
VPIRATGGLRGGLLRLAGGLALAVALLPGCQAQDQGSNADPSQVDATTPPEVGGCRMLTPGDISRPSNATATVPCTEPHTAETFAVGTLPSEFATSAYDDLDLAAFAFRTCGREFQGFLGADESLAMRTVLSWAMFRPSEAAWGGGARWYRCDAVGGGRSSTTLVTLPDSARGLLEKPDDAWLACVKGQSVATAPRVPCSRRHTFRAVTTIKLGRPDDEYPGDEVVEERTRGFCSDSVAAWLGYPVTYSFAYTWFPELDWQAGNRRSVCWARTNQ